MSHHRSVFLSAYIGMLLFGISLITLGSVAPGLKEKFSLDAISFGTLFSILPFGILSGSLFFGPIADRYGFKIIFLLAGLSTFIGFEGIAYAHSLTILKASVFLFGFGGGILNGASNAVVSDISESDKGGKLEFPRRLFCVGCIGHAFHSRNTGEEISIRHHCRRGWLCCSSWRRIIFGHQVPRCQTSTWHFI